jgi:membrane-associated phospholipid phosphatase
VLTDLGAFPVVAAAVLLTAGWAALRGRAVEAVALVAGFLLTWLATDLAKAWTARERPVDPYTTTRNLSYPSGHTSNAMALIACAVVLVRAGHGLAVRFAAVTVAVGVVVFVGASRIYLRAHYLSDVLGGAALGAAVLSLVGIVALVVAFVRHNGAP